jgi:hypothetical protein
VASDHVVTGGGAWAEWFTGGALLTASYPFDAGLTTWEARSKDHDIADPHILHTFVVGMKISGMSRTQLFTRMTLVTATSSLNPHPSAMVTLPASHNLLGGGAKANYSGAGSLLTASYPWFACTGFGLDMCSSTWFAASKDHQWADPSTITAYAIGVERTLTFPLDLLPPNITVGHSPQGAGIQTATYGIPSGYIPTSFSASTFSFGPGATGVGLLLYRMSPNNAPSYPNLEHIAQSKDHEVPDAGTVDGMSVYIRKRLQPGLTITPAQKDFGALPPPASSQSFTFTIRNTSTSTTVSNLVVSLEAATRGAGLSTTFGGGTCLFGGGGGGFTSLAPNATCTVTVTAQRRNGDPSGFTFRDVLVMRGGAGGSVVAPLQVTMQ